MVSRCNQTLSEHDLEIERVFEKKNIILSQNGHEFSESKGSQPMQNFLHGEKIHFCKIKSLYTINNLCGN